MKTALARGRKRWISRTGPWKEKIGIILNPNSPEIMEVLGNIPGDPKEHGPWIGKDSSPFKPHLSETFLVEIIKLLQKTRDYQAGLKIFFAMLVYLDKFLKDLI